MHKIEAHDLTIGQSFSYGENELPVNVVTEVHLVDDECHYVFLYVDPSSHSHAHVADHTPVWV